MGALENEEVNQLVQKLLSDYGKGRDIDKMAVFNQPDREKVVLITNKLLRLVFPGYYREKFYKSYNLSGNLTVLIEDVLYNLSQQIEIVLCYEEITKRGDSGKDAALSPEESAKFKDQAYCLALTFLNRLPEIRDYVESDLMATFDGDPAASSLDDIILSYPGIKATTINRLAHVLFLLNVPLIPRMMTEYAHSVTGIDIHPGAQIGRYFCMDHGTGVVVGSTTIIGDHVKVYQGVTLGALSTAAGQALHGIKRHPTIKDNVTIYSGASILGGETVIGEGSVIGSNAFITKSIPAGTRVTIKNQELVMKGKDGSIIEKNDLTQSDAWFYVI
ncbi:MAG: serine acetyltransferase [Lachnospiraceae bacterium]|uniref:Serine acetyltransferase n=1 Tax=Candidatus Weimeria bifida TaxID=2599074 RepID=A0A6N7J132_9FIRM|nr:serine acetyltransferase [Candidatus Weimeria bifida]RRF96557.1 MAG: serine acetyltransferase [Lachnospiraceae bacterium]